jgi:hypothetical protein
MTTRTLSLAKGGHRYVFRYSPGCEEAVMDQIMRLAEDAECNFDWLDAAAMSFHVVRFAAADREAARSA